MSDHGMFPPLVGPPQSHVINKPAAVLGWPCFSSYSLPLSFLPLTALRSLEGARYLRRDIQRTWMVMNLTLGMIREKPGCDPLLLVTSETA